jgi:alkylhydroperoxidase family enzyme
MGLTEAHLQALSDPRLEPTLAPSERAVLRYAEAMSATPVAVSDAIFAELRSHLDELQIVELTSAIAWENYRARFNRAFDVPAEGYSQGSFCPAPLGAAPPIGRR